MRCVLCLYAASHVCVSERSLTKYSVNVETWKPLKYLTFIKMHFAELLFQIFPRMFRSCNILRPQPLETEIVKISDTGDAEYLLDWILWTIIKPKLFFTFSRYATQLFKPNIRCWTKYTIGLRFYHLLQHFSAITPQSHKPMLNIQDSSAPLTPLPKKKKRTNKQKSTLGAWGDKATLVLREKKIGRNVLRLHSANPCINYTLCICTCTHTRTLICTLHACVSVHFKSHRVVCWWALLISQSGLLDRIQPWVAD